MHGQSMLIHTARRIASCVAVCIGWPLKQVIYQLACTVVLFNQRRPRQGRPVRCSSLSATAMHHTPDIFVFVTQYSQSKTRIYTNKKLMNNEMQKSPINIEGLELVGRNQDYTIPEFRKFININ